MFNLTMLHLTTPTSFSTRGVCFLVLCIFSFHYECNDPVLHVAMGGFYTLSSKVLDSLFLILAEGLGCKVLGHTYSLVTCLDNDEGRRQV
jgi:hypothetical protein